MFDAKVENIVCPDCSCKIHYMAPDYNMLWQAFDAILKKIQEQKS